MTKDTLRTGYVYDWSDVYENGKNGHKRPVATLVSDGYKFGVSICSKHDQFNKKIGRELAIKRMNNILFHTPIPNSNRKIINIYGAQVDLFDEIFDELELQIDGQL